MTTPNEKILVASSDLSRLEIIEEALKDTYDIIRTGSGMSTLKLIEEKSPVLVIVDTHLEDTSGANLVVDILKSENIPILVIDSGSGDEVKLALQFGAIGTLTVERKGEGILHSIQTILNAG